MSKNLVKGPSILRFQSPVFMQPSKKQAPPIKSAKVTTGKLFYPEVKMPRQPQGYLKCKTHDCL